ncbi:hypothetical protein Naga_100994g2 [Nannochloropsis gaditana]|uniref:SET domain-containing protein n=1 Tax=Nannochloropsis gaditana TaxID=72520 RepID=W7TVF3_9STRA|nr:hypothetical protein Naga_100994g2 [Nannochloropsis gaditana]
MRSWAGQWDFLFLLCIIIVPTSHALVARALSNHPKLATCHHARPRHPSLLPRSLCASATPSAPASFQLSRDDAALDAFRHWLNVKGGIDLSASSLGLRRLAHDDENSPGNADLELFTTRPIEKDQILLAIPPSIVLTSELPSPALRDLAGDAALDDMGRLALRLLHEVSQAGAGSSFQPLLFSHATSSSSFPTLPLDNSGWLPYVRVLPSRNQMDLPFLWEEDGREGGGEDEGEEDSCGPEDSRDSLLALLAPSPLYDDIVALREEMRGELESLRKAVLAHRTLPTSPTILSCLTWENWSWARAVAMSRPYVLKSRPSRSTEEAGRPDFFGDPVLQLLPLLDMANHDDAIHYAVQPGDGVFTSREEVQLVADRDYPEVGAPFLSSYGPLSSATKFYSFGFLDTLSLPPSARSSPPSSLFASRESREDDMPGLVPAQGTALLVLSLDGEGCTDEGNHKSEKRRSSPEMPEAAKEEMTREERRARNVFGRKLDVLSSMGLKAEGQRVEISTRTLLKRGLGSERMAATVRMEGGEEEGEGGREDDGGGMDRLRRYLRLKHMGEEDIDGFLNSPPPRVPLPPPWMKSKSGTVSPLLCLHRRRSRRLLKPCKSSVRGCKMWKTAGNGSVTG